MLKIAIHARLALCFSLCVLFLFVKAAVGSTLSGDVPTPLEALVEEGLENNFMLKSLRLQAEALKEDIISAGALDDPRLGIALANIPTDTFRFDQEPMTQKQISLAQKIPWLSKLSLKKQRAVLIAKTAEIRWMAERLTLVRRITTSYYELALAVRSLDINRQSIEKLNRLLQSSESRYASGKGLQQDVLQAQVELSRLLDEQNNLADRRRMADSKLNELLNRTGYQQIKHDGIKGLALPGKVLEPQVLKDTALEQNLQIVIRKLFVQQAKVNEELARKDFYPDFDMRLSYGQRDDDQAGNSRADFFSAGVGVNIPIWKNRKQKPKLEGAIKRSRSAQRSLQNLQLKLPHRIDALISTMERLRKNYDLYKRSLLLQAEQWANSAQIAYEVGQLEFNSMINAQIQVLRLNLRADTYLLRYFQKQAELKELLADIDPGLKSP